jgi:formylglycine-generating enzyme required for sulfatase activity
MRKILTLLLGCGLLAAQAARAAEIWVDPVAGIEFVQVAKACYRMGLPAGAFPEAIGTLKDRLVTEQPHHEVCLDAFWIARTELTWRQWHAVMGGDVPTAATDRPVAGVTWHQARDFAARLSAAVPGDTFRLPTEAEWEYACRAGAPAAARFPYQNELDDKAWYSSPYNPQRFAHRITESQPVGTKRANKLGLHDMLGNVWEWVEDDYAENAYFRHTLYNPVIRIDAAHRRVIRGGGLRTDRYMLRCETRGWMPADITEATLGFRLVRPQ